MKSTLHVIKIGGDIIDDAVLLSRSLTAFAKLESPKILVHGGGKRADRLCEKLNIPIRRYEGRRLTDAATLDVVSMVYAGSINPQLVAALQAKGTVALGVSGADLNCWNVVKRPVQDRDYGFVGDVLGVRTEGIQLLLDAGITPVFSALTHDGTGQLLNTNADTLATSLASAFASQYHVYLRFCGKVPGVLMDVQDPISRLMQLDQIQYQTLVNQQVITAGMLPKLSNAFTASAAGVARVSIGDPDHWLREDGTIIQQLRQTAETDRA